MNSLGIIKKRILVIGDIMLDIYFEGDIERISPEAPVPVFKYLSERYVLGGASNVAANLAKAGQSVAILATLGSDKNGSILKDMLEQIGVDTTMVTVTEKVTTSKTRFLANNNQQVMRTDVEDNADISKETEDYLLEIYSSHLNEFDIIVISDYRKGLLTSRLTKEIIKLAEKNGIRVIADIKENKGGRFNGAFLIKPNKKELANITGKALSSDAEIKSAAMTLRAETKCAYVLTTLGAKGMLLVGDTETFEIPSVAREVYDVTGAGDTAISYLAVCLANDMDIKRSVEIANIASGIEVGKVGTSQVSVEEVERYLVDTAADRVAEQDVASKLINRNDVSKMKEKHQGKSIVFTNGCFDILHIGHTRYLQKARTLGDVMIVGVNSDESVKRLKGETRPINSLSDRMEILASLTCVDYVIPFDGDTPYELISDIRPDVLVKGGDYNPDEVVGKDIVESKGGRVVIIPLVEGRSTTAVVSRMSK